MYRGRYGGYATIQVKEWHPRCYRSTTHATNLYLCELFIRAIQGEEPRSGANALLRTSIGKPNIAKIQEFGVRERGNLQKGRGV